MDVALWIAHWIKMVLDCFASYVIELNGVRWYYMVFDGIWWYTMG